MAVQQERVTGIMITFRIDVEAKNDYVFDYVIQGCPWTTVPADLIP